MEPLAGSLVCPVCFLYLREGISLKSHLQTHSKDKVIEALLNRQNSVDGTSSSETETMTSVIRDASSISLSSESRVTSYSRSTLSILPTPSYMPTTNHINQTPALNCSPAVNNIQYMPAVNNSVITQAMIGNSCNSNITYQQYITSDGNIVLIPMYMPVPQSSVMVSNNLMNSPVINSCVVVPPSPNISSVTVVDATVPHETPKSNTPQPCVTIVNNCNIHDDNNVHEAGVNEDRNETPKTMDDYEKENDAEVASIFQMPTHAENNEISNSTERLESSVMDVDDDKVSCESYDNADISDHDYSVSDYENELQKSSISPDVSVIRICGDYESDSSYHEDETVTPFDEAADSIKSDLESIPYENSKNAGCSKLSENARLNDVSTSSVRSPGPVNDRNEQFDFIVSNSDNATHILPDNPEESVSVSKIEKEHYILPNNDIPRNSPINSDYSFIGLRNSFLSSASLISSVNKAMFADVDVYTVEKNNQVFDKDQDANATKEDKKGSYRIIGDLESAGSSRISPFNIQTDESMPARGELSGQESLSGAENSMWELQVQQNHGAQRYNMPCKKENSDVKIGLQSLMTEINIKMDVEAFRNVGNDVVEEDTKIGVQKLFKKKILREFRCFHCKLNFDSWKSRQLHIANEHAEEDGLTIESLFSKKVKSEQENVEDDVSSENIMCRICTKNFENSFAFLLHLKNLHGIKKRNCVCPTCLVHFANAEEYQEHIEKVHPYECMTCSKKFHTRSGYMLHQKRHMKVKPYGCDVCDKSFVTKQKLTEHMNIHTGDNPIKCDMCDSNFKRYSNYQQHKKYLHMNKKRKLKDFICDCGEVFHSKTKLIWHREIHDEKPKQCPFCVERFIHTASLTRHVRKWHNETYMSELVDKKKIRNVTCPVCNVTYLHTSLQTHMKIHEGVKPFSCGECSKTFRTKWNLQLHRWTHMSRSAKPYKCKLCVKAYIHKTDYDAHLRSHSNCRPYSCNVCGRQFIRKYNCIRHMREHKEPRTFKCNICKKMFSRSYYLTEHRKTHTGEKPHICHVCGKSSATKSNHNKHVKMHNNIRESVNSEG